MLLSLADLFDFAYQLACSDMEQAMHMSYTQLLCVPSPDIADHLPFSHASTVV